MSEQNRKKRSGADPYDTLQLIPLSKTQEMFGGESRSSIYRALQTGQLAAVKLGRRLLITKSSIDARLHGLPKATFKDNPGHSQRPEDTDPTRLTSKKGQ